MLSPDDVVQEADDVFRRARTAEDEETLRKQMDYLAGNHSSVYVPRGAQQEYKWLVTRSRVNIMPLVIDTLAQALYVDGWRGESDFQDAGSGPWDVWQANRMDARQTSVHRCALAHGESWVGVWPGDPLPVLRPVHCRDVYAIWDDPIADEYPTMALERRPNDLWRLHEPEVSHELRREDNQWVYIRPVVHGLAVVPLVRYVNRLDLSGLVIGEIDPLMTIQDQVNATTFGLLMAQTFAAFRQRWAIGMVTEDEKGNELPPPNVSVARILTSDSPDTRFGEFEATDLGGYINSREASLRHAAIISQVPPHYMLGQMANLSAEALAAAEAGQMRKISERQELFGESHESMLRLAALYTGDKAASEDMKSEVIWRDAESRSLAQYADALGKIAAQLEVPPEALWEKLPDVTQEDIARWKQMAEETRQAESTATARSFGLTGSAFPE